MQKSLILQREIKDDIDGLTEKMEAKMDCLKDQIKSIMDDKVVEYHIEHQQQVLQFLNDNLTLVQNRMKPHAYQHPRERSFDVCDWLFLWLQP